MVKIILKFTFAFGLIYYLLHSGKLDLNLINQSFKQGYAWLYCILILACQAMFTAIRWGWILKSRSDKKIPFRGLISTTWIGLFFSSFLPGAVTGDIFKVVYARKLDPDLTKTFLFTSVLFDRIFGLMGLLILLGMFSLFNYSELTSASSEVRTLLHFNFLLFVGAIGFIVSLFLPKKIQTIVLEISNKVPVIGNNLHKLFTQVWFIGKNKKVVIGCISFSVFIQAMNCTAFFIISSPFYSNSVPFSYLVSFIPIGFMAVAVPVSPAGLGVGHMAFEKLFSIAGVQGGASFFNLYFLALIFVNLQGIFPYLLSSRRTKISEIEDSLSGETGQS